MNTRREHAVIANMHRADIQHHAVEVSVKVFAQINVISIVAAEARLNISACALCQKFRQNVLAFCFFIRRGVVIAVNQMSGPQSVSP